MPIAYQEFYMVLRAENLVGNALTSAGLSVQALGDKGKITAEKLQGVGSALVTSGTVLAGIGAAGVLVWYKMVKAAMDYNTQVAYTQTQTQGLKISFQQIYQMGLDIAKRIAVPLASIQMAFYNIFSTMNVNVPQAKQLVTEFAKAAVAGQTDISTATKNAVAEMHAFKKPISDVNQLLNIEFEMVKQGRGTYSDFMGVIGQAIPVYAAYGQTIQELSANMAFMTRNGSTAGSAAAGVARALEATTKKGFQEGLKKLGIGYLDAAGHAKSLDTLVTEIAQNPGWADAIKKNGGVAQAFVTTFGQGTIQARRFFDVAIPGYKSLNQILGDMNHPNGAMNRAYIIMAGQMSSKVQILKNDFKALEIVLGNDVMPVFSKFVGFISKAIGWFSNLNPHVQKFIAIFGAISSVVALLGGGLLIFAGVFTKVIASFMMITNSRDLSMLADQFRLMGGAAGEAALEALPWIAAILAVAAAVYFGIKYHKELGHIVVEVWHKITAEFDRVINYLQPLINAFKHMWSDIVTATNDFVDAIETPISAMVDWFKTTFDSFTAWWHSNWGSISEIVTFAWRVMTGIIKIEWSFIVIYIRTYMQILEVLFKLGWSVISDTFRVSWSIISSIVRDAWKIILTIINIAMSTIASVFQIGWDVISAIVRTTWDIISGIIRTAWTIVIGIITVALDLLTGKWGKAWNDLWHFLTQIWHDIQNTVREALANLVGLIIQVVPQILTLLFNLGKGMINLLWQGINDTWHLIYTFFSGMVSLFTGYFTAVISAMYGIGKALIEGLWNGVKDTWHIVTSGISKLGSGLVNGVKSIFGIKSPSTVMADIGKNMALGLVQGITANTPAVINATNKMLAYTKPTSASTLNLSSSALLAKAQSTGGQVVSITMPKGAVQVTLTAGSTMSPSDLNSLTDAFNKALDDYTKQLVAKLKSVKAA